MFTKEELRAKMSIYSFVPAWLHQKPIGGSIEETVVFRGVNVNRYKLHFLLQMKKAEEFFSLLIEARPVILESHYVVNSFRGAVNPTSLNNNISEENKERLIAAALILDDIPTSSPAYEDWINGVQPPNPCKFKEVL